MVVALCSFRGKKWYSVSISRMGRSYAYPVTAQDHSVVKFSESRVTQVF